MSIAEEETGTTPLNARGEVRFIAADAQVRLRSAVNAAGWLLVGIEPFGPAVRGQLEKAIEATIDDALTRRGGPSSGVLAQSSRDLILQDQLFRAQASGLKGITLALGSLAGLCGEDGALDDTDSAALRFYAAAARRGPIALWLDDTDLSLLAYGPPMPLSELLGGKISGEPSVRSARGALSTSSSEPVPDTKTSVEIAEEVQSDPPPVVVEPVPVPAVEIPPPPPVARLRPAQPVQAPVRWRSLARDLDEAHGPKPLSIVEKLFVERYVPLAESVAKGDADARAQQSLAGFAKSFAKSYIDAFAALKITRKRPSMVFDVPQISQRIARLHGARNVVLLLVDGMRFDVGLQVARRMAVSLEGRAVCAEQTLLWSALPSSTAVQVRLLGRGVQGLLDPIESSDLTERDMVAPKGKSSSVIRRMRVGGRELHKLDVIQACLANHGAPEAERIDELAELAAEPIGRFATTLPSRTLLFIFGDHGFVLPPFEGGTGPAEEGGALPEQILVPAHGWLIGGVQ